MWELPIMIVPEPPMTLLPWAPVLPTVAAGKPLMRTVEATSPTIALPHALLSVCRAAAKPSKKTSGDPEAIGLTPCPGTGQEEGSVMRAAGFPDISNILVEITSVEVWHKRPGPDHTE